VFLVRAPDGSDELVKRWPATPWELCKLAMGIAQPQRQLRGARRLLAAGVATPRPRGDARLSTLGGFSIEIRLAWVDGESLLEVVRRSVAENDRTRLAELGEKLGAIREQLDAHGIFHRDAKLSNFIVTPSVAAQGSGAIVAIDTVGIRASRDQASERQRWREAIACELSPQERLVAEPFLHAAG
jgi:tRNA A-37 threonylcarbamoyl transferase component Bud32